MRRFIDHLCEDKKEHFYRYVFGSRFFACGEYIKESVFSVSEDRRTTVMTRFSYFLQPVKKGGELLGFRPTHKTAVRK